MLSELLNLRRSDPNCPTSAKHSSSSELTHARDKHGAAAVFHDKAGKFLRSAANSSIAEYRSTADNKNSMTVFRAKMTKLWQSD